MTFLWPEFLWLLLAVPACIAAYLVILGKKKHSAVRYASLVSSKKLLARGCGGGAICRR